MEHSPNIWVVTPCLIVRDRGSTIKDDRVRENVDKARATATLSIHNLGAIARLK